MGYEGKWFIADEYPVAAAVCKSDPNYKNTETDHEYRGNLTKCSSGWSEYKEFCIKGRMDELLNTEKNIKTIKFERKELC